MLNSKFPLPHEVPLSNAPDENIKPLNKIETINFLNYFSKYYK